MESDLYTSTRMVCAIAIRARFFPRAARRQKRSLRKRSFFFVAAQAHYRPGWCEANGCRVGSAPVWLCHQCSCYPGKLRPTSSGDVRKETGHMGADLGQNTCGSVLFDSRNRLQQLERLPKLWSLQARQDLGVNLL